MRLGRVVQQSVLCQKLEELLYMLDQLSLLQDQMMVEAFPKLRIWRVV